MSFRKFQIISPQDIGCPEDGHVYLGRDNVGLWEKYSNCEWVYIITGSTTGAGTSGTSGSPGSSGVNGDFLGSSGSSGESGVVGSSGTSGSSGKSGTDGTTGTSGSSGFTGTSGSSGKTGTSGSSGTSGTTGTSGSSGKDGNFYGSSGSSGTSGVSGYGGSARRWTFSTSAYPTSPGYFYGYGASYNFNSIDYIRINQQDADGQLLNDWIEAWTNGFLKIEKYGDASKFGIYAITSGTTNTKPGISWYSISGITNYNGNGALTNGQDYLISYVSNGQLESDLNLRITLVTAATYYVTDDDEFLLISLFPSTPGIVYLPPSKGDGRLIKMKSVTNYPINILPDTFVYYIVDTGYTMSDYIDGIFTAPSYVFPDGIFKYIQHQGTMEFLSVEKQYPLVPIPGSWSIINEDNRDVGIITGTTVLYNDFLIPKYIICSGSSYTIYLPEAFGSGIIYNFRKMSTGTINIEAVSSPQEYINGSSIFTLTGNSVTIVDVADKNWLTFNDVGQGGGGGGTSGTSGSSGKAGSSGTSGTHGSSGKSGSSGTSGAQGPTGPTGGGGSSGSSGETGSSGTSGIGSPGSSGSSGETGSSGSSGTSGTGTSGSSGNGGFTTDPPLYYDIVTDTLFTPNITLTGSTVTVTNIQNTSDNDTKLILSSNILKQVTGTSLLDSSPNTDHTASGMKIYLVAASGSNFGDVGYIDSSGKVVLGKADSINTSNVMFMCADDYISGNTSGNWLLMGIARNDSWSWSVGGKMYLSVTGTTNNTLTQTAPSGVNHVIQILGIATAATRMYFNPSLVQVEHL